MAASKALPEAGSVATTFSEEHYRTLFESIDQGFCTVEVLFDENGNLIVEPRPAH
jgi:hypothetical protein